MAELVSQNWVLLVIALLLGIAVAWWVLTSASRKRVTIERDEAAEEGPARRNQALIDAPPAAASAVASATGTAQPAPAVQAPIAPTPPPSAPVAPISAAPTPVSVAPEPVVTEPPAPIPARPTAEDMETPPVPEAEPLVEPGAAPVQEPSPSPAPAATEAGGTDDLTRIKGLGPKLAEQLRGMGVTSFAQIAGWDDAEIDRIDEQLGRFRGRIRRDDWPQQARFLAVGDVPGYESRFGKL